MNKAITAAQQALDNLKNEVIGIFRNRNNGVYELILQNHTGFEEVTTVYISSFGALQYNFNMPVSYGKAVLFPDGKNMNDMLNNPFEWAEFINQFE